MLKKINLQLFADNAVTEPSVDDQVSVQSSQETVNPTETLETPATEPTESVETKVEVGENDTSKQTKNENAFFKSMRIKAEAEANAKLQAKVDEELKKFKQKLAPVLPEGYQDVDEYLKVFEEDTLGEEEEEEVDPVENVKAPIIDDKAIEEIVNKKLEANPELQSFKKAKEREKEDEFIVKSFEEMKSKFSDIKVAEDVPLEVWEAWQLGKNGRSLISCMKEYRYDNDIEKAKQKGAAAVKAQMNSVAHTGAVNGGTGATVQIEEGVHVPPETQKMLKMAGVPESKWVEYYKKYHR